MRTGLLLAALALLAGTAIASAQEQAPKETAKEKKWQPIAVGGNVVMATCLEEPATAKTEWGGQMGVEVRYWYLNFGLRYSMAFSNLLTTEGAPDVKNQGLAGYVGVTWQRLFARREQLRMPRRLGPVERLDLPEVTLQVA